MDILQVLQTLGICIGALALAAIAIMLFLILSSFLPNVDSKDSEEPLVLFAEELPRQRPRKRAKKVRAGGQPATTPEATDEIKGDA